MTNYQIHDIKTDNYLASYDKLKDAKHDLKHLFNSAKIYAWDKQDRLLYEIIYIDKKYKRKKW